MQSARNRKFWVQSVSDPRWDYKGEGVCTRFETPQELDNWLKKKEEEFGKKPSDLIYGFY